MNKSGPPKTRHLPKLHITTNPLAAYAEKPRGVFYQDQEQDEEVIILLRRHLITNTKWIAIALIAAIVPTIPFYVSLDQIGLDAISSIPGQIKFVIALFWYAIIIGFVLENFFIWYFNVYLVTNKRIVDVDFKGLMRYSSDEAALHQIQDVQHNQRGVWQLLFKFGTVHLQTSGSRQNLDFEKVPMPARVADIITDILPIPTDVEYGRITLDKPKHKAVTHE